jgi:hypothetical protein
MTETSMPETISSFVRSMWSRLCRTPFRRTAYFVLWVVIFSAIFLHCSLAWGQEVEVAGPNCKAPSICLPKEDVQAFVALLKEKKCMQTTEPKFQLDEIKLFVDKEGRVFYSGEVPHPYQLTMSWCTYDVVAQGHVKVLAAVQEPPIWGFRFRPKAYTSFVLAEPFYPLPEGEEPRGIEDVIDAGVMADVLYYDILNLNLAVGFQSFGAGIGVDLTQNFGAYAGYGLTWGDWHHSPNLGLWFGF